MIVLSVPRQTRKFQATQGHSNVPAHYHCDWRLGTWVQLQRDYYKLMREGKKCKQLSAERYEKLENAGFIWESVSATKKSKTKNSGKNGFGEMLTTDWRET